MNREQKVKQLIQEIINADEALRTQTDMKKAKITAVQAAGTWTTSGGKQMYQYEYTFDDNVTIQANHLSQDNAYNIGDEVEYTVTREHPEHGKSGKIQKPGSTFGNNAGESAGKQENIARSVALNNAVQIHQGATTDAEQVLTTANTFLAWLQK